MIKQIFCILLLIGTVSASGKIPILYLSEKGNQKSYCDYNKDCLYNIQPIQPTKNIFIPLLIFGIIISVLLSLGYIFILKMSEINGYKFK